MYLKAPAALLAVAVVLGGVTGDAAAQPNDANSIESEPAKSYWSVGFMGSLLTPLEALEATHEPGLASGLTIGFIGRSGFGAQLGLVYSPFPRVMPDTPGAEVVSHFGLVTAAPSYTARWGVMHLWVAGGGAALAERTTTTMPTADDTVDVSSGAGAYAGTGLELHLFEGGGPTLGASYVKTLTGDPYELYTLSAGVTFTF